MEVRSELPVHPVPNAVLSCHYALLRVHGLVRLQLVLEEASLAELPHVTLVEPFTCEEGWTVPSLRWSGVRLADIVALADPLPPALFVRVCAGAYVLPLSLAEAETAVLCNELSGRPLAVEHGAPWRLVMPGAACYASVKWVDRLEVAPDPGENTAQTIARARRVSI